MNILDEDTIEARNLLVYVNNPTEFEKLVQKHVVIHAKNKTTYKGYVKTVDPVSESVVLVNFENGIASKLQIILGHAIDRVQVLDDISNETHADSVKNLFSKQTDGKSAEELNVIKNNIKSWLLKNRFPVKENKDDCSLVVAGALKILPPYDQSCCVCENEIILGKIQGLISTVPENLEEWI